MRIGEYGGIGNDTERFVCEESANAEALVPCAQVFAVGAAAVGGYHSSQRAVHEDSGAATEFFHSVVEGPNEVG